MVDLVERLCRSCNCNIDTSPCGAEEECRLALEAADTIESLRARNAELVEVLKLAANELNIIRARDGAPQHIDWHRGQPLQTDGCTKEWWNELTERCFAALAKQGEG